MLSDDFSTNRYSGSGSTSLAKPSSDSLSSPTPSRHPDLCFTDGNLAILTGENYFLVHKGLLCRHSLPISQTVETLETRQTRFLEGRLVLELPESSTDVYYFLLALYDGISALKYDVNDFTVVSAIFQLATRYEVKHLRADLLRGLSVSWPRTLGGWELRESKSVNNSGGYVPRERIPHPILVINLARACNAPELLPAAFYDLSRCSPSECATGYTCPISSEIHHLAETDLLALLRGKEHGSRFLSTFIVNELEGRDLSAGCLYRMEIDPARRRTCQAAFEAVTFEILKDINGTVSQRSSDPLFAMFDAEMMQTRDDVIGRTGLPVRACEYCRCDFGTAVDSAREEFWRRLPAWFGVDPQVWS